MNAEGFAATITALAAALAEGKTSKEIDLLSSALTQLADTLATIAAFRDQGDD